MTVHSCPACQSAELKRYLAAPDPGLHHESLGSSRMAFSPGNVLRCRHCGHGFRENQPSLEQLAFLYREMDVRVYEAEQGSRSMTAAKHVKLLNSASSKGKLLDVGSASGAFLEEALRAGWDAQGLEPNAELWRKSVARLGEGRVLNSMLEQAPLPPASFDVITLWDVLEHVVDPGSFLKLCAGLTKPGGMVLLKAPDLNSFTAHILRTKWPLLLPEHLGYFTRASLCACAERAGLRPLSFRRSAVTFTAGYFLLRAGQHGIPLARWGGRLIEGSFLGDLRVSLRLGELYVVLRREDRRN
jgi:SAM-dependent methyltransferase